MRGSAIVTAGIAGMSALLTLSSVVPSIANQVGRRYTSVRPTVVRYAPTTAPTPTATPTIAPHVPCPAGTEAASKEFVGVNNTGNSVGGADAAVLGGSSNEACSAASAISGGDDNVIGLTDSMGTQAEFSFVGGGFNNSIAGAQSFIGGGMSNSSSSFDAFIGAGSNNISTSPFSFIGAGQQNEVTGGGAFIGAGGFLYANAGNTGVANLAAGNDAFIGAGDGNDAAGSAGFIGSGQSNTIPSPAPDVVVAGGNNNYGAGSYSTIGGGSGNKAEAPFATVPGGADNEALNAATFVAGYHAEAAYPGSFVWSDDVSGSSYVADKAADQFVVRASGGVYVYSSETLASGVTLAAGSGAWASLSDRNAKTDVQPIDERSILAKVRALPVNAWEYKTEKGVRHAGPMAQDFYAAFGVGADDRHITSVDEDGVTLVAVKALVHENADLEARQQRLQGAIEALNASHRAQTQAFLQRETSTEREVAIERDELAALRVEIRRAKGLTGQ